MSELPFSKRTALVTGASSGIGVDIARALAARGANLILVARREEAMRKLGQEITARHPVDVSILPADLARPGAAIELAERVGSMGLQADILVNNAGFGLHGSFVDLPWERQQEMLQLDIVTLTHLCHVFAPDMVKRGWGRILLIASIGAFQPTPTFAAYGAAKAYVLQFGVALRQELKGTGVSCTVLSPGVTATEFFDVAGQQLTPYQKMTIMSSAEVAGIGVRAMERGRASVVAGWFNTFAVVMARMGPAELSAWIAARIMKP